MKKKNLNLSLRVSVDPSLSNEQIADNLKELFQKQLDLKPNLEINGLTIADDYGNEDIRVKIIDRRMILERLNSAAGYESRLWEKATC